MTQKQIEIPMTYGQLDVVDAEELRTRTREGWCLIALVEEEDWRNVQRPLPQPQEPQGGSYSYRTHTYGVDEKYARVRYLIGLDANRSTEARTEELHEAYSEADTLRGKLHESEKSLQLVRETLATTQRHRDAFSEKATSNYEQLQQSETQRRKLEGDLAKVRTAIGELKFKELVG